MTFRCFSCQIILNKTNIKKIIAEIFIEFILCQASYSEKAMAPHSTTLAWRIPWMEEPGGLLSMGSHRVGHNWRDLAAAAVAAGIYLALSIHSLVYSQQEPCEVSIVRILHKELRDSFKQFTQDHTASNSLSVKSELCWTAGIKQCGVELCFLSKP